MCLLVMVTTMATSYAGNTKKEDDDKGKMVITLTLNNVKAGQQLVIKDLDGLTIYKEAIATTGLYNNTFNLKALPEGTYYFEHYKDLQIKRIPFTVAKGEVSFDSNNGKTFFKPVVRKQGNVMYLTQLALDKEDLNVAIYYSSDVKSDFELIHAEHVTDTLNIERIYQLSPERKGEYRVVLTTNGEDFVENFTL